MEITYICVGDYLLPNLTLADPPDAPPLGYYGMRHKNFLRLPEEIVARTELTDFPRDPYKALDDPKWRKVYESDYFQLALCDAWAWLVWPKLGVRGGMEQFSGYDEELDDTIGLMVAYYISNTNFLLWREVVQEYRAHEDFDSRLSSSGVCKRIKKIGAEFERYMKS